MKARAMGGTKSAPRPKLPGVIARWLEIKSLTVADACRLTSIPVPTFYRLLAEEEKFGRVRRIRGDTVDRLVAGSHGFITPNELHGIGSATTR